MPDEPLELRPMRSRDAEDLATLRLATAEAGLLTVIGRRPLEVFFRLAADDPDTIGFVAREDGPLLGYALCTTAAVRLQRSAIRSSPRLWLAAAALAIRDPRLLGSAIRRLRALASPRRVPQDVEPALRLFDIAVTQDSRGRGLGRRLLDATIAAARERGYPAMGLSVLADNERALRLYGSSGFVPNQRGVRDDGQTYITMRLSLKMSGEPEGSDAGS